MSKQYLSKSVLVLSLLAAASGAGLVAQADETPAANDISAASPAADSSTAVTDNKGDTALPASGSYNSTAEQAKLEQANPAPAQAETTQTAPAESAPLADRSSETMIKETDTAAPKVNTLTAATAPVKKAVKTPDPVEGQTVDMRILSTTDLHTNLVNYDYYQDKVSQTVGLAKTAILIEEARKENSNIFSLTAEILFKEHPLVPIRLSLILLKKDRPTPCMKLLKS